MEIKVKEVTKGEKSKQEIEQELLNKHEESLNEEVQPVSVIDEPTKSEFSDDDVISYIKNRYDREINSVEELFQAREEREELPEDVATYLSYKKDTGRGFKDFVKLNKDYDEVNPEQILKEYLTATEKGLDEEDINVMMESYDYDEDYDDEATVKKTKLNKKKAIAKAKDYFESEKEKYRMPLESSGSSISNDDKEKLDAYNQYIQESKSFDESLKRRKEIFDEETSKVFGNEFNGFEFAINDDKNVTFSPGDAAELKKVQSDANNFLKMHLDENGTIKNAASYHKALAVAMNPDKFAKFFYEQGKSIQADDTMRRMKNTDMSMRSTPEVTNKGGMQIKAVNPDSGRGLKIRSRKK